MPFRLKTVVLLIFLWPWPAQADELSDNYTRYVILHGQGRYEEAIPFAKSVLAVAIKAGGSHHPDTAVLINNLAELHQAAGHNREAERLYKHALRIWDRGPGPDHPEVAKTLTGLGTTYAQQGRYEDAEPHFEKALSILVQRLAPSHPDLVAARKNYDDARRKLGLEVKPRFPESSEFPEFPPETVFPEFPPEPEP